MVQQHELSVRPLDLQFALPLDHGVSLDRHERAVARRLGNAARRWQVRTVELADELAAFLNLAGFCQKDRLVDDRTMGTVGPEADIERAQGVFSLFSKRASPSRNRDSVNVTDARECSTVAKANPW